MSTGWKSSTLTCIYSLDVAPPRGTRHSMDSLPEPSEVVEDEWAAMKIRFTKEGLQWDRLSQEERLLQVTPHTPL